jgi:hypothetical protein
MVAENNDDGGGSGRIRSLPLRREVSTIVAWLAEGRASEAGG